MRVSQIPVRQDFTEASGLDTNGGTLQETNNFPKSQSESSSQEYLPGSIDTDSFISAKETQDALLTPVVPPPIDANLNISVVSEQSTLVTAGDQAKQSDNAAGGNANEASQLVGVQGKPVATSESVAAQTVPPQQTLSSQEETFDLGSINPLYWLLLVPAILIPLLLFRFVMGTSSGNDLERYKFRGPTVKDPEDPTVRGRFKKRPRTDRPTPADDSIAVDTDHRAQESSDLDDKLSFLDEAESDVSLDVAAASTNDLESVPVPELAAELSSEPLELGDFDPHGDEPSKQFAETKENVSNLSSESRPLNNQSDSDLGFDFFSDDDDLQASDNVASDELAELSAEEVNSPVVDELPSSLEATPNSEEVEVEVEPLASVASVSDASDDDLDFFSDDSSDDFSLDDDGDAPEIAASAPVEIDSLEETLSVSDASDDDLDLFSDDSNEDFSLDDGGAIPEIAASAPIESDSAEEALDVEVSEANVATHESEDQIVETAAVAAVGAAGAAAVAATAKSGSWMSRFFGGRKKKQKVAADQLAADDTIAATAVKEVEDEVVDVEMDVEDFGSESDESVISDDRFAGEPVLTDGASTIGFQDDASGEFDLADSGESFSLEGDDSSDGMFDDDSDAGYSFDAEEVQDPPLNAIDATAINDADELGAIDDVESMWEEEQSDPEEISVDASSTAEDSLESIGLAQEQEKDSDLVTSAVGVECETSSEEFSPIGHTCDSVQLPLLEDQMLGKLVDSSAHRITESSSVAHSVGGVAAAAGLASDASSGDSNDALLAELQRRIDELESQNATIESERSSLQSELEDMRETQPSAEDVQTREDLEKQLSEERLAKEELEQQLTAEAEAKKQAALDAEQARAEAEASKTEAENIAAEVEQARAEAEASKTEAEAIAAEAEQARAEAEAAKAESEEAVAEAAEFRQKAEEAMASAKELEQAAESQQASVGSLGGSLLAAAGGAVAGAAMTGGSDESPVDDDPFRLEPDQVKKMLLKLKTERKKRLKTKEHFLQVDAKRREVAQTLKKVTGELDSLKLEFEKVSKASADGVSKESFKGLMEKLNSAEDALKKNKQPK